MQLPLHCLSAHRWLSAMVAFHFFSTSSIVFHLKHGILWFPAEIAAFTSKSFVLVISGSPEIHVSPSISIWFHWEVTIQPMVHMLSPCSVIKILIPPVLLVILLQLYSLGHLHFLAQVRIPLMGDMRSHQDLLSVSLEYVSHGNQTFVSTQSNR